MRRDATARRPHSLAPDTHLPEHAGNAEWTPTRHDGQQPAEADASRRLVPPARPRREAARIAATAGGRSDRAQAGIRRPAGCWLHARDCDRKERGQVIALAAAAANRSLRQVRSGIYRSASPLPPLSAADRRGDKQLTADSAMSGRVDR